MSLLSVTWAGGQHREQRVPGALRSPKGRVSVESRRDRAEAWLGQTGLISLLKTRVASKYYTCHAGLCGKGFEG